MKRTPAKIRNSVTALEHQILEMYRKRIGSSGYHAATVDELQQVLGIMLGLTRILKRQAALSRARATEEPK